MKDVSSFHKNVSLEFPRGMNSGRDTRTSIRQGSLKKRFSLFVSFSFVDLSLFCSRFPVVCSVC